MPALTDEEVTFFAQNGYLIRENALNPVLVARAREKMWQLNDLPRLQRDDPSSWTLPFTEEEESPKDVAGKDLDKHLEEERPSMSRKGFGFWMSGLEQQVDPELLDLLPLDSTVQAAGEQLLGKGRFEIPSHASAAATLAALGPGEELFSTGYGTRGIYCTLPRTGADAETDGEPCEAGARGGPPRGGHWDSNFSPSGSDTSTNCLMASCYLDDVPKGGGGFTLWPGSCVWQLSVPFSILHRASCSCITHSDGYHHAQAPAQLAVQYVARAGGHRAPTRALRPERRRHQ
jgi:hypothetical protein